MDYETKEQSCVVEAKVKQGYELFGKTKSTLNGLNAYILKKDKHLIVINSLGYDEHYQGKTWRIYE